MATAGLRASGVRKLLGEPLLHFLCAGAILFGVSSWLDRNAPSSQRPEPVRIGEGEVRWVRETFSSQWRRDPTPDEMRDLLTTLLGEELLAREARALGLDQQDTVVRRRLAQKLGFLVEDTARLAEPGEDALRRFYEHRAGRYRTEPRISFRQIFFSPARGSQAAAEASAARTLLSSASATEPEPQGDPLALEAAFADIDPQAVSSLFGASFARVAFALPVGAWSGPVRSAYGTHLVLVSSRTQGTQRPYEEIRKAVSDDWHRAKQAELKHDYLRKLRDKYGVAWDDGAGPIMAGAPDGRAVP